MAEQINIDNMISLFGETVQLRVLVHMINSGQDYLSGIAQAVDVSHSSVARVMKPLIGSDIVQEVKLGKQIRLFRMSDSYTAKDLQESLTRLNSTMEERQRCLPKSRA